MRSVVAAPFGVKRWRNPTADDVPSQIILEIHRVLIPPIRNPRAQPFHEFFC